MQLRSALIALSLAGCSAKDATPPAPQRADPHPTAPVPAPVATIDAAVAGQPPGVDASVASSSPPQPVDPGSLLEWPVTDKTAGVATSVFAIDANADVALISTWPAGTPLIAVASHKVISGRVAAPSPLAAARSLAAIAGIEPRRLGTGGGAALFEGAFAAAPQIDLINVFAAIQHTNIVVAAGTYPDVDIVGKIPASAALAALAELDGLVDVRDSGMHYLLPRDAKLPPAPKAPGDQRITLIVSDATPGEVVAAIAAIVPFSLRACGATRVSFHVLDVTPAQAARALLVASGAAFDPAASCPIGEVSTIDTTASVPVIATSGANKVAIVRGPGGASLIRPSRTIAINDDTVSVNDRAVQPPGDHVDLVMPEYAEWAASLRRTSVLIHRGARWAAIVDTRNGRQIVIDPDVDTVGMPFELKRSPPPIGPTGVQLSSTLVPFAK